MTCWNESQICHFLKSHDVFKSHVLLQMLKYKLKEEQNCYEIIKSATYRLFPYVRITKCGLFPYVRITKCADFANIYIPAVFKGAFTVMSNGV